MRTPSKLIVEMKVTGSGITPSLRKGLSIILFGLRSLMIGNTNVKNISLLGGGVNNHTLKKELTNGFDGGIISKYYIHGLLDEYPQQIKIHRPTR